MSWVWKYTIYVLNGSESLVLVSDYFIRSTWVCADDSLLLL